MTHVTRSFTLILAIALSAGCTAPSAGGPAQAPSASAPAAKPVPPAGTNAPPAMTDALLACLAADRGKWLAGALSESDLAQMWGDLSWIEGIKDRQLQKQYQAVFDLSAGQHTVSAQRLMSALNVVAGALAPPQAIEIEGYMRQQYAAEVPADADAFDPELRAALEASAAQLKKAQPIIAGVSAPWKPYAELAVEGAVYSDAFATACAIKVLGSAPKADVAATEKAVTAVNDLMNRAAKPATE